MTVVRESFTHDRVEACLPGLGRYKYCRAGGKCFTKICSQQPKVA